MKFKGLPKSVMLTHFNMSSNIMQFLQPGGTNHRMATSDYQDIYICLLPFFHTYGVTILMNTGLETGAKLVTLPQFEVQSFFKAIDDHTACSSLFLNWALLDSLVVIYRKLIGFLYRYSRPRYILFRL